MRALGVDLGARRIGVALSDATGTLASPHLVLERTEDLSADHAHLARLVEETGAEVVVVGLPLSLDGSLGPAARGAIEEAELLGKVVDVPVETFDERLTTVTAERHLRAASRARAGTRTGAGGGSAGAATRARRRVVDQAAAAVMLQSWLDARGGR